jgi:hypothetical protein
MTTTGAIVGAATLPSSLQVDFTSAVTGRGYRIQVALPLKPEPPAGYPVLYVLDGDANFAVYSSAARMRAFAGEVEPAIVVGIGYPEAEADMMAFLSRRNLDLTPSRGDAGLAASVSQQLGGLDVPGFGEADAFLEVIETEIKPRLAALAPTAPGRDLLYGHSLGGLFVLHALFKRPEAFAKYLALSPSIWWDGRMILTREAAFALRVVAGEVAPQVFIGVGAFEQTPERAPQLPAEAVLEAAMVDNAVALGERLAALPGPDGYRVETRVFDGQTHVSVGYTAVTALLDFALPPTGTQ